MEEHKTAPRWVFISHSSRDQKVADTLCQSLESRGLSCWIASRDIAPSEGFQDAIVQALENSCAMVLVFSQNSNNSREIKKEIALAGQYLVPVLPVRVEDVLPSGAFRYELVTRQWIDLFSDWEGSIEKIVQKMRDINATEGGPSGLSQPPAVPAKAPRRWLGRRNLWRDAALALVVLALLPAAYFLGSTAFRPSDPATDPDGTSVRQDPPAQYPEMDGTRLSGFTLETPPHEYKAGVRIWERIAPDRWKQTYPDETVEYAKVVARSRVDVCDGTIIAGLNSDMQAFLPDRNCENMTFRFRRPPATDWVAYVQMENVR
jgi:hypothetical protein